MNEEKLWHTAFRLRVLNQRMRELVERLPARERKELMPLLDASNADLTAYFGQVAALLAAYQKAIGTSAPADVTAADQQDQTIQGQSAALTAAGFAPLLAPIGSPAPAA